LPDVWGSTSLATRPRGLRSDSGALLPNWRPIVDLSLARLANVTARVRSGEQHPVLDRRIDVGSRDFLGMSGIQTDIGKPLVVGKNHDNVWHGLTGRSDRSFDRPKRRRAAHAQDAKQNRSRPCATGLVREAIADGASLSY